MSGKVPRPQICGGFHLSESSSDGRNIPLEGGKRQSPPSLSRVNLKDFVSERFGKEHFTKTHFVQNGKVRVLAADLRIEGLVEYQKIEKQPQKG